LDTKETGVKSKANATQIRARTLENALNFLMILNALVTLDSTERAATLRADVNPTLAGTGECVQKPLKLTLVHAWPVSWAKTVNVNQSAYQ